MEDQYLAFVSRVGTTSNGEFVYNFFFTQDPEVVWGEDWNIVPSSIVPDLAPSMDTISLIGDVVTDKDFLLARENSCFSMQDCIDGIIALLFTRPREEELILNFGEEMDSVKEKLNNIGLDFSNIRNISEEKENEIIDNVMSTLDGIKDNDSGEATGDFGDTPEDFDDDLGF
jgi:hypothetical protein